MPGPYAQRQRRRFVDLRLNARVARLECADELGEHSRVATELISLIADHPLREDLYALRMRALYRAGRAAQALAVYAAAREVMVAELGMDPGPELRELQARILSGAEPAPVDSRTGAATTRIERAPAGVRPRQLPPAPGDFVGRERLRERLGLALRVAHGIRADYPDGQLYVDLRSDGGRLADPADVLVDFLLALGMPAAEIPATPAARAGAYRTLTADRRILVLLDNASDAAQVTPLLPGTPGNAALITTRHRSLAPSGATRFEVPVPDEREAAVLLDRPERETEELLEHLLEAGLLEPHSAERYRFHDLVRAFAARRADREDPVADREAALSRLTMFLHAALLQATSAPEQAGSPGDRHFCAPPTGPRFADADQARSWLLAEHTLLVSVLSRLRDIPDASSIVIAALAAIALSGLFTGPAYQRELERVMDEAFTVT